jgi:hypothetical protein
MRIQHVAQTVKGWPNDTAANRQESARLADTVEEHIRWRLWHGQVQRALDFIGDTLGALEVTAKDARSSVATPAGKVVEVLGTLETYVAGQSGIIIDYANARHCEQPIWLCREFYATTEQPRAAVKVRWTANRTAAPDAIVPRPSTGLCESCA